MDKIDSTDSKVKDNYRQVIKQLNTLSYFYDQHYNLDCRDTYLGQRLSFAWDIFTNETQIRFRKKRL